MAVVESVQKMKSSFCLHIIIKLNVEETSVIKDLKGYLLLDGMT